MSEETHSYKSLWILAYHIGTYYSLKPFYARSEDDVEQQIQEWIEQQSPTKIVRESLRAFPGGFKLGMSDLPGRIPDTR